MTREKIIKTVNDCVQYNANQGTWSIDNRFADELLKLIDEEGKNYKHEILSLWAYKEKQIKKETAKEIISDLKGLLEFYVNPEDNISLYEYYCKKYTE